MILHEKIRNILSSRSESASSRDIAQAVGLSMQPETIAAVEAHLLYDRHCRREDRKWRGGSDPKMQRVLQALSAYYKTSGKKIFRLSAALKDLPMAFQPTEDELKNILSSSDAGFKLFPNAMVKKVDGK